MNYRVPPNNDTMIKNYLKGTPEEIEKVEAHRKASPFKIGFEPNYLQKFNRLSRRKKKSLKKWYEKADVRISMLPKYVMDRFTDRRVTRGVYLDLYRYMKEVSKVN